MCWAIEECEEMQATHPSVLEYIGSHYIKALVLLYAMFVLLYAFVARGTI